MTKKRKKKLIKFFKKINNKFKFYCADSRIFQILRYNKFNIKNKIVLDLGFGNGSNLIEFKKRGGKCYGVDISKEAINRVRNKKVFKKSYVKLADICDINFDFFKKKFDLIYTSDCIYYLDQISLNNLFYKVRYHLKNNGFFLVQYIQCQLSAKKKIDNFNYLINDNLFKVNKNFFPKYNPIRFISNKEIKILIKVSGLHLANSTMDIFNDNSKSFQDLLVNRYILLQKKI